MKTLSKTKHEFTMLGIIFCQNVIKWRSELSLFPQFAVGKHWETRLATNARV